MVVAIGLVIVGGVWLVWHEHRRVRALQRTLSEAEVILLELWDEREEV